MAFSPDVLVTTLQELLPGVNETFTKFHPAFDHIIERGNKRTAKGHFIQFDLTPSGPGRSNKVVSGNETIQGGRKQTSVRTTEYAGRIVRAFDVPGIDLADANNEQDLVGLIKKYPETDLAEFREEIAKQLVMGGVSDVDNMLTWNGDATYDPRGLGSQDGIFSFAAALSQSSTVFGVQKNSIVGWHNQYAHINNFSSNGRKQLRKAYWDASQQMATDDGAVDLIFADRDTYDNYVDDLDDQVQIVERTTRDGDRAPGKMRSGIKFLDAVMYPEQNIVPADFTTTAATQGVAYGIHSATWTLFTAGGSGDGGADATSGFFAVRPEAIRLPTQEMWRYETILHMGMYCTNLRCNFVVTGGANA